MTNLLAFSIDASETCTLTCSLYRGDWISLTHWQMGAAKLLEGM